MRVWCLTSIEIEPLWNDLDDRDPYLPELFGAEKYALTEIYIGGNDDGFIFELYRDDIGTLTFEMHLERFRIKKISNEIIDILMWDFIGMMSDNFGDPYSNIKREDYVKRIRIRNIKRTSFHKLEKSEKNKYEKYAKKIEDEANGDPDRREAAFEKIGKLNLSTQTFENFEDDSSSSDNSNNLTDDEEEYVEKQSRQTVSIEPESEDFIINENPNEQNQTTTNSIETEYEKSPKTLKGERDRKNDLVKAIMDICYPPDKDLDNLIRSARYNQLPPGRTEIRNAKINDKSFNLIRDFRRARIIDVDSVWLKDIKMKWFEALHLKELYLINVEPFAEYGSWKRFEMGIQKCKKLSILQLNHCNIEYIHDQIFDALPESIKILSLSGNNLSRIAPTISKLNKLELLNLSNNKNLSDLPWNSLPENLSMLYLKNTNFEEIPSKIKGCYKFRLKELEISSPSLIKFSSECLNSNLKNLYVKFGGNCENIDFPSKATYYFYLSFKNAGLSEHVWHKLPPTTRTLNLTSNNLTNLACDQLLEELADLIIKKNGINFVDWESLRINIPKIETLNLSKNDISKVDWEELSPSLEKLNLSFNPLQNMRMIWQLENLAFLHLDSCQLEKLPEGLENLLKLRKITLANNYLTFLPQGFENISELYELDLSGNKFIHKNSEENLWNRLPKKIEKLKMNGMNLEELPCQLARILWKDFEAIDCHLKYICPMLYYAQPYDDFERFMNVCENDELKYLSFIPKQILYPPYSKILPEKYENIHKIINEKCVVESKFNLISNKSFRTTDKWFTDNKIHKYLFSNNDLTEKEKNLIICHCCAGCGTAECDDDKIKMIKQFMVMDFYLILSTKEEDMEEGRKKENELVFQGNSTWLPGKWKSEIKTRMCENCINQFKEAVNKFYNEFNQESTEHENELPRNNRKIPKAAAKAKEKQKTNNFLDAPSSSKIILPSEEDKEAEAIGNIGDDTLLRPTTNDDDGVQYTKNPNPSQNHQFYPPSVMSQQQQPKAAANSQVINESIQNVGFENPKFVSPPHFGQLYYSQPSESQFPLSQQDIILETTTSLQNFQQTTGGGGYQPEIPINQNFAHLQSNFPLQPVLSFFHFVGVDTALIATRNPTRNGCC